MRYPEFTADNCVSAHRLCHKSSIIDYGRVLIDTDRLRIKLSKRYSGFCKHDSKIILSDYCAGRVPESSPVS